MNVRGVCWLLLAVAVAGCATDKNLYPVGWQGTILTTRYGDDLPMTVYFPERGSKPFPVVVYNHGRPFGQIQSGDFKLSPGFPLIGAMNAAGIAVALPVRGGYSPSSGRDRERITCNNPARHEFENAIKAARADVAAAVRKVKTLPDIDAERVFVGGTSAGGFASGGSMAILEGEAKGIFVLNGGRCGKRGSLFRGHEFAVDIFSAAAAESSIPVVFYASATTASSRRLRPGGSTRRPARHGNRGARTVCSGSTLLGRGTDSGTRQPARPTACCHSLRGDGRLENPCRANRRRERRRR